MDQERKITRYVDFNEEYIMPVAAVMAATAVVGAISSRNSSKRAAAAQTRGQDLAAQQVTSGTQRAEDTINRLFPQAQQSAQQGFQGAIDVFGQTLPQQANLFQGGNVAAQQALLAGQPQFQNAILGRQVDLSGIQPFQAPPIDFGFTNQQVGGQGGLSGGLAAGGPISPLTGLPIPNQAAVIEPASQGRLGPSGFQNNFQNIFNRGF